MNHGCNKIDNYKAWPPGNQKDLWLFVCKIERNGPNKDKERKRNIARLKYPAQGIQQWWLKYFTLSVTTKQRSRQPVSYWTVTFQETRALSITPFQLRKSHLKSNTVGINSNWKRQIHTDRETQAKSGKKWLLVQSAGEQLKGQREKVNPAPILSSSVFVDSLVFLGTP